MRAAGAVCRRACVRLRMVVRRIPHPLRSALLPALVLACLLEIAKFVGVLGWLDGRTLTFLSLLREPVPVVAPAPDRAPRLVLIDDESFEAYFGGRTPLDRDRLAELIKAIAVEKPRLIAIDLDLAPDRISDGRGLTDRRIDDVICTYARPDLAGMDASNPSCLDRAKRESTDVVRCGVPFVLLFPFETEVERVNDVNSKWRVEIEKALAPCVTFAKSDIEEQGGRAIYFTCRNDAFAIVAHRVANWVRACAHGFDSAQVPINTALVDAIEIERRMRPEAQGPLVTYPRMGMASPSRLTPGRESYPLAGEAVFVGGAWGVEDQHGTAVADKVSGVVVHAAIFWTLSNPLNSFSHAGALALDVAIGIVTGAIFGVFWRRFNAEANFLVSRPGVRPWCTRPDERDAAYAALLGWGVCAWAALASALALVFGLSGSLLALGLWLNPGPMILGLFLHALIASREAEHRSAEPTRHAIWAYFGRGARVLRCAVLASLVIVGIALAFGLICNSSTGVTICRPH